MKKRMTEKVVTGSKKEVKAVAVKTSETSEQVEPRVVTSCVRDLNKLQQTEIENWIAMGRKIEAFGEEVKKVSTRKNPDIFTPLVEHPDSTLHASQLRNILAGYRLWVDFGGETKAPKVSLTSFIVVVGARVNRHKKEEYLRKAEKDGLSVSQLKAIIKGGTHSGAKQYKNIPVEWKKVIPKLDRSVANAFDCLSKLEVVDTNRNYFPADIRETLIAIAHKAMAKGIFTLADIPNVTTQVTTEPVSATSQVKTINSNEVEA